LADEKVQCYQCCDNRIEDREEEKRRKQLTHKIALEGYKGRQHSQSPFQFQVIPE
jgi:hypothetical protein